MTRTGLRTLALGDANLERRAGKKEEEEEEQEEGWREEELLLLLSSFFFSADEAGREGEGGRVQLLLLLLLLLLLKHKASRRRVDFVSISTKGPASCSNVLAGAEDTIEVKAAREGGRRRKDSTDSTPPSFPSW